MSFSSFRPDPYSWKWNANPGSPPRNVSLLVKARILLGGTFLFVGFLWLGFSLCFLWLFGGATLLRDWVLFQGNDIAETEGAIILVEETNIKLNDQRVLAYYYEFSQDGVSYQNRSRGFANKYQIGQTARIEFRKNDPRYSRIINLNTGKEGLWFSFPFVSVGLAIIGLGFRNRLRGIRLLRDGLPENAVLLKKEKTGSSVNDKPVYKYTFGYTVANYDYEVTARTHDSTRFSGEPKHDRNEADNSQEVKEPILYDPNSPRISVLLDSLPGGPRIDENGQIDCSTDSLAIILLVPLLVTFGHLYWITQILAP